MMKHSHPDSNGQDVNKRSLIRALGITAVWFVVELSAGFYTNSLALLADAAHMMTDLAAMLLSLFALKIAARPATHEKTFGYLRAEILAALANGVFLVLIGFYISYEAYQRFFHPPVIRSTTMLVVSAIGLGANLIAARLLAHSDMENLNLRGAFLHVMGDILGSVGAIIAGVLMVFWRWYLADPIVSVMVSVLILYSSWHLLRDSVEVLLEGTPRHLNIATILSDMGGIEGVLSVHDLHVWSITSGWPAMSCHVVLRSDVDPDVVLRSLSLMMRDRHGIEHTTIQIERNLGRSTPPLVKELF
jgi:cobalt-zinc-cadmium efflux system protein